MFVVDTNVLVYAADASASEHEACRTRLESWRAQVEPWFLTWGIAYEFVRVTTHPRVLRRPWRAGQAWAFLAAIDAGPGVHWLVHTDRHLEVGRGVIDDTPRVRGNLVFDLHTVALMREHGIRRIYTFDTDFRRFDDIEVLDPLQS